MGNRMEFSMLSSYRVVGNKIEIKTAYCEAVVNQCRKWAGKYQLSAWIVPLSRLPEVQKQLGTDCEDEVEVEVGSEQWDGFTQIHVGWYVLASRRGRDSLADVYADLVVGEIPPSGGSVKNPSVKASADARFRLWVPRDFAIARGLRVVEVEQPVEQFDPCF